MREGPSDSATKYEIGIIKTGNDGNKWIIVITKKGVKRWTRIDVGHKQIKTKSKRIRSFSRSAMNRNEEEEESIVDKLEKRLYDKFFKWWRKMAEGEIMIIYKDDRWEMIPYYSWGEMEQKWMDKGKDKNVKKIIWSSMSTDGLSFFVECIIKKFPVKVIEEFLGMKEKDVVGKVLKYQNKLLRKEEYVTKKDYELCVYNGYDDEKKKLERKFKGKIKEI